MVSLIFAVIALCLLFFTLFIAWKHPHLRRMAVRNILIHKHSALLTIAAAMVGTALITSSLLLQSAMDKSVTSYFTQHFGKIASDLPAVNQEKLAGRTYFLPEDIAEIERLAPDSGPLGSIPIRDKILPITGFETVLIKPDPAGRPLLLNPNTYVYGFDYSAAREFDPGATQFPRDLKADEIVLTAPVAERLEVNTGDTITVLAKNKKPYSLRVSQIVAEQGLSGYRGANKALATALVSLDTARELTGVPAKGFTNLLLSALPGIDPEYFSLVVGKDWQEVNVLGRAKQDLRQVLKMLPIFTIVSLNAILIGMVLIINIFRMFAEERRQEFGILRAIGLPGADLARLLQLEGSIYALISGVAGSAGGIGLSYLLLLRMRELLSLTTQYDKGISIGFSYHVDPVALIGGFAIGFLLVFFCVWLVSNIAAGIQIVEALSAPGGQDKKTLPKGKTVRNTAVSLLSTVLALALLSLTLTENFRVQITAIPIFPLVILAIGMLLVLLSVTALVTSLGTLVSWVEYLLRPFSFLAGVLRLALRYPEVNRTRTGLLIFMFAAVLFITSLTGVIGKTMSQFFGGFDPRAGTGGYDLTATTLDTLSTGDLQKMLSSSLYADSSGLDTVSAVQQVTIPFKAVVNGITNTAEINANGIEDSFALNNSLKLKERDTKYSDDRAVWQAVAADHNLVILSDFSNGLLGTKKYQVGDQFLIETGGVTLNKKIIGIAEFQNGYYAHKSSYGIWLKQSEAANLAAAKGEKRTTFLIKVKDPDNLKTLARGIEKEFTLQNIFPLVNPRETILASSSFAYLFFSLFEGFSALATVIGIVGLMIIMLRVVRERRQQIGMLRAIGVSSRTVYRSILTEGALTGIVGISLGLLIGSYTGNLFLKVIFLQDTGLGADIPVVMFPYLKLSLCFAGALVLTMLSAALPARKALSLTPAEATRYVG